MKKFFLFLLAILMVHQSLVFATPVYAAGAIQPHSDDVNYCDSANYDEERCVSLFEGLTALVTTWKTDMGVEIVRSIAIAVWVVDRLSLEVFDMVTGTAWLTDFKSNFLEGITIFLPDVLRDTAFGDGGLMYLALVLAGLIMIIPVSAQGLNRLVKPDRVIVWGVLLSVLFVSGSVGYDVIDQIENLRYEILDKTIGTNADYGIQRLVIVPMHATEDELTINLDDNLYTLPTQFETRFFPEEQKQGITMKIGEGGIASAIGGAVNTEIESYDSVVARTAAAVLALFYAGLGIGAASIILLSGINFIVLGVAALILILFLFAALPLGFFEFGQIVLGQILDRYVSIVIHSLSLGIFIRLAGAMVDQLPNLGTQGIFTFLEWLLFLGVFFFILRGILNQSFSLLSASFSTLSTSMATVWGASPNLPSQKNSAMDRAKRVAGGAVTGAMLMGGPQGALMGAAGAALSLPVMMRGTGGANAASRSEPPRGDVFANNGIAPEQPIGAETPTNQVASRASVWGSDADSDVQNDEPIISNRSEASASLRQATLGVEEIFGAQPSPAPAPSPPAAQAESASERAHTMAENAKQQSFGSSSAATDAADTARTTGTKI